MQNESTNRPIQIQPDKSSHGCDRAGTLGARIALMLASSGEEVQLYDAKATQLEIAERFIELELPS